MKVGVIGAGRAGTAVAVLLLRAGHSIVAVSGRGPTRDRAARFLPDVPVVEPSEVARRADDLVIVAVPDDLIATMVDAVAVDGAFTAGRWVAHLSGATPLAALDAARAEGARRLGLHPLQTFPDPAAGIQRIPGSTMAVAADDDEGLFVAERLAEDLMTVPFRLADAHRALYHAAAVFASNYVIAATAVAEELLAGAGVPDPIGAMRPLQRATFENVASMGAAAALTGPAARGDVGTIERNLGALAADLPWAVPSYVEMARVAADLAVREGRLTSERRAAVEDVLSGWS